jgi:hypothetical protein
VSGVVGIRGTGTWILVDWHRPPARVRRGHAAPVDTGSTAQRYGLRRRPVKPSDLTPCRGSVEPAHAGKPCPRRWGTCGQPLDPQVSDLLASALPSSPRWTPHLGFVDPAGPGRVSPKPPLTRSDRVGTASAPASAGPTR